MNEDDEELLQHSFIQLDAQLQIQSSATSPDIGSPLDGLYTHHSVRWHVNKIALLNVISRLSRELYKTPGVREGQWIAIEFEEEGDQIGHRLFLNSGKGHLYSNNVPQNTGHRRNEHLLHPRQDSRVSKSIPYIVFGLKFLIDRPNR